MSVQVNGLEVVQNAYVVADLEEACAQFHKTYGIGPFIGGGEAELSDHVYRGTPADPIRIKGVFVQSGHMNIELVQVLSTGPCAFTDMYAHGQQGLHHAAMFCDDYERQRDALVAAGYPVVSEFKVVFGAQICYVDTRSLNGHFLELYPEDLIIRAMYEHARLASVDWDGKGPLIRPRGERLFVRGDA